MGPMSDYVVMRLPRIGLLALGTAMLAFGCATETEDDAETAQDAVIAGRETYDHPEIGMVMRTGRCTGTLIRPNVVIYALHCTPGGADDKDVSA